MQMQRYATFHRVADDIFVGNMYGPFRRKDIAVLSIFNIDDWNTRIPLQVLLVFQSSIYPRMNSIKRNIKREMGAIKIL